MQKTNQVDFIFAWNFYTIQLETLPSPFSFRNLMAKPSKVHFVQTSAASLHQAPVILTPCLAKNKSHRGSNISIS